MHFWFNILIPFFFFSIFLFELSNSFILSQILLYKSCIFPYINGYAFFIFNTSWLWCSPCTIHSEHMHFVIQSKHKYEIGSPCSWHILFLFKILAFDINKLLLLIALFILFIEFNNNSLFPKLGLYSTFIFSVRFKFCFILLFEFNKLGFKFKFLKT